MKEIYINTDDYNSDSIRTIQGNNNAEEYKIYLQYDNEKIDLTNKTVNLGFLKIGSTEGDIIENLNVTDPKNGEITLKITNKLSKKNGTYSCQLAILGEGDFLEHTATFTLTVENNIFSDITKAIADSKDFTYLENILDKASKLSEKLKENTSSATNANSNLESNITEANNINSKLLENTSTVTSLNKNLESNIDLAKEVKETIKDLDTKNIEATEKIETLTGLNAKATELSNNIQQGLPLNSELVKNVESAKTVNNELIATNNDAKAKKTDLDNSLEEAKKYIAGLDGSQNIPQIRLDVDALQNGLKSNQALSYEGSSIVANETLEGRTEGMRICGRTLVNLLKEKIDFISSSNSPHTGQKKLVFATSPNKPFTFIADIKYTGSLPTQLFVRGNKTDSTFVEFGSIEITSNLNGKIVCVCKQNIDKGCSSVLIGFRSNSDNSTIKNAMILEGDWTNKEIPSYFEGLKSFGEAEKVEDKYKISILSHGKNLFNFKSIKEEAFDNNSIKLLENGLRIENHWAKSIDFKIDLKPNTKYTSSYNYKVIKDAVNPTDTSGGKLMLHNESTGKYFALTNPKGVGMTFTTPEDIKDYKKIILYSAGGGGSYRGIVEITNIQIEEGTQATQFEAYKEDKKDILIKEPLKEREYIYEDNGQVKVCRKSYEYTLNGENEDWIVWTNSTGDTVNAYVYFNRMTPNLSGIVKPNSSNTNDRLPANQGGYLSTKEGFKITSEYFAISIHKSKLGVTNVNDPNNSTLIKKWLKENPITMICQLATPTIEIVENCVDIDLDTFQDKTYFNILNSLPGTLDFKVPSNIGSVVQNMAKEVNNIWDVINNLLVPGILDVNKKVALATIKNNLK
ncbi:BppU family phage baseplate upper protein [Clostridium perfringens]|uniref:BppU family phage baseplate upper protein n=1 Tax=Clostridium perfringens TaxID=1502 RepID=UPI002148AE2F|nr:BppU family phage baseplate upper protein [Clostridium perfringens]UUR87746.1 BppU family phage baseplate upper protein [Clostridium perfringens]